MHSVCDDYRSIHLRDDDYQSMHLRDFCNYLVPPFQVVSLLKLNFGEWSSQSQRQVSPCIPRRLISALIAAPPSSIAVQPFNSWMQLRARQHQVHGQPVAAQLALPRIPLSQSPAPRLLVLPGRQESGAARV